MTFPLNETGITSGLLSGFLFGYVLENAGFGNPNKLTAQFRFTDWSVFKVMFSAIVVAAIGMYLLRLAGLADEGNFFINPPVLGAAAIGGGLIGAGFALGGYCPGTSVVGLSSGRIDALVFLVGLLVGTWLFAGTYASVESLTTLGTIEAETLPQLIGAPEWLVLAGLGIAAVAVFIIGTRIERRLNGPLTVEQATDGRQASTSPQDQLQGDIA
jgi:uncharacterized protein